MPFQTRADLAAAIAGWLNRADLTAQIPDFIRLAEARMSRLLRDPEQILSTVIDVSSGSALLPSDFGELVSFGATGTQVSQVSASEFGTYTPQAGDPRLYAIDGSKIRVTPGTGGVATPISYYRAIPALTTDASTNWLLARAPDAYLYGSLLQAEFYGWNDERLPLIKSAWDEAIAELRADGASRRWGVGVAPKLGRT